MGMTNDPLVPHQHDFDMLNRAIMGQITYQNHVDEVLASSDLI